MINELTIYNQQLFSDSNKNNQYRPQIRTDLTLFYLAVFNILFGCI